MVAFKSDTTSMLPHHIRKQRKIDSEAKLETADNAIPPVILDSPRNVEFNIPDTKHKQKPNLVITTSNMSLSTDSDFDSSNAFEQPSELIQARSPLAIMDEIDNMTRSSRSTSKSSDVQFDPPVSLQGSDDSNDVDEIKIPKAEIFTPEVKQDADVGILYEEDKGKKVVVAGTVEQLVKVLADTNFQDSEFIQEFLLSYRYFIRPLELLENLMERYQKPLADDAVKTAQSEQWIGVVRLRIINVLKKWFESHFYDFEQNPKLLERAIEFIEMCAKTFESRSLQLTQLINEKKRKC